ncbi:MAG: MbnP family protein [Akkermansiaceae bacterium]
MLRAFIFSIFCSALSAGTLTLEIEHRSGKERLQLSSLRYQNGSETFSVSRLAYLLSEFALQKVDGSWVTLANQFAYLDVSKHRTSLTLKEVPPGSYQAVRYSLGVPKKENHADPTSLVAKHPLNPNLNQLHWDWTGGYIFLALEGRYRKANQELSGFVYHLANDQNLSRTSLPARFTIKSHTVIGLVFDLESLLTRPRAISFQKDGHSTHSHPGDPIASALVANLQSTISLRGVFYPDGTPTTEQVKPKYLPKTFTPFPFKMSKRFPRPHLPMDNPLLAERVELGKKLFFDPILSGDRNVSCASCHLPEKAFSDPRAISRGVAGAKGNRNSMPLFNLAWKSSFFWDGRAGTLREQVLLPIEDHREMAAGMPEILTRLQNSESYRLAFSRAFAPAAITAEKLSLALENYLLTLTSYDSKFDRAMSGKAALTASEKRGMELFFTEYEPRSGRMGADCFHCHGGANFSDHQFHNNGLKPSHDLGRAVITGKQSDRLLFSTPSLRNLTLTAPYMHDGRFKTLAEVIAHYNGPMHRSITLDPNLAKHPKTGIQLSVEDQKALVDFLKSLSEIEGKN